MEIGAMGMVQSMQSMTDMQGMNGMRGKPPDAEKMAEELSSQMLAENDADGDGVLSVDETGLSDEVFAELDADGDGFVSPEELANSVTARMNELHAKMAEKMGEGGPPMEGMGGGNTTRMRASNAYQSQQQGPTMSQFFESDPSWMQESEQLSVAV